MKYMDIVPAKTKWERWYAHAEYLRIGIHIPFSKRIEVK